MTAFNGRLKPKRVMGLPLYTVLLLAIALPMAVLGLMLKIKFLSITLFIGGGLCFVFAIFFFIIGDEAPFFWVFIRSVRENNNVTAETMSRFWARPLKS